MLNRLSLCERRPCLQVQFRGTPWAANKVNFKFSQWPHSLSQQVVRTESSQPRFRRSVMTIMQIDADNNKNTLFGKLTLSQSAELSLKLMRTYPGVVLTGRNHSRKVCHWVMHSVRQDHFLPTVALCLTTPADVSFQWNSSTLPP